MVAEPTSWAKLWKVLPEFVADLLERAGHLLKRRKPNLYVHISVESPLWCIAGEQGSKNEMMQIMFSADFNHDDPKQTLVIVNAYPKGKREQKVSFPNQFVIPPCQIVSEQVAAWVIPLLATPGNNWRGRFILVDQFKRKHKTEKIVFRWAGPPTAKNHR